MGVCLIAGAKDKSIQEFILDAQTVYTIPVSGYRVTTISFPGPISAIDAAQATIDPQKPAAFLIAHTKGSSFFSVRAEARKATTNVNIRWNNKTYVIELVESDEPLLSVTFQNAPDTSASVLADPVTPSRLLALLDKAKAYPLLKAYHSETVAQVEYRNFEREPRILDCTNYAVKIEEVFRFNPEDTLVFRVGVTNKTSQELRYAPNGFSLRVGERTYTVHDDQIAIREGDKLIPLPHLAIQTKLRIRGLIKVRDAVRQCLRTQLDDAAEEDIQLARTQLNQAYDRFVARHGPVSGRKFIRDQFSGSNEFSEFRAGTRPV